MKNIKPDLMHLLRQLPRISICAVLGSALLVLGWHLIQLMLSQNSWVLMLLTVVPVVLCFELLGWLLRWCHNSKNH